MRRFLSLLVLLTVLPLHGEPRLCTPQQLQDRLTSLESVVSACSAAPGKAACDPTAVGDDLRVTLPSGVRTVEFDWLRNALADAQAGKAPQDKMTAARERLARDLSSLAAATSEPAQDLQQERAILRKILASADFPQQQPPSLWERLRDQFLTWLATRLDRLGTGGSPTHWLSQVLLMALILASCGGLLLWFSRAARRQRLLIAAGGEGAKNAAVSLRDWQLWLAEARELAAEKQWREAIHRLYWAAIAAMERRGAWRPDRARTPREYLALLASQSGSSHDLLQLTRTLERFWYGGEIPAERDYEEARIVTERLVA
jgi:hypothetical protein